MSKDTKKIEIESAKEVYKVSNWPAYNLSLKNRGSMSVWLSSDIEKSWYYREKQSPGGEIVYSDHAIELCLTFKHLLGLAYRQTEGFVESLFELASIGLVVPSYSQLQRRSKRVKVSLGRAKKSQGPITLVIDSTGLKVYGEGEWKVRKHGWNKHRTWRKLHMGSNGDSLEIVSVVLTTNQIDDAEAGKTVIKQLPSELAVEAVAGDGAYDKRNFRGCLPREVKQLIPPRRDGANSKGKVEQYHRRDPAVERIKEIGRSQWKKEIGYHIRSKSEVNMYRYKMAFGEKMSARKFIYEQNEVRIKSKILNQFLELGMPNSYKVQRAI